MSKVIISLSRYTSKGKTVYAIMTAKPPKPTVKLLAPKTSTATNVKRQYCFTFYKHRAVKLGQKEVSDDWIWFVFSQVTLLGNPVHLSWSPLHPSAGLIVLLPELPYTPGQAWTLKLEGIQWALHHYKATFTIWNSQGFFSRLTEIYFFTVV